METVDHYQAERWHLKKEIHVAHIITTLVVAVSAVSYVTAIEHRVALLEHNVASQKERDQLQDQVARDAAVQLRSQLERIEAKLDRLVEKDHGVRNKER